MKIKNLVFFITVIISQNIFGSEVENKSNYEFIYGKISLAKDCFGNNLFNKTKLTDLKNKFWGYELSYDKKQELLVHVVIMIGASYDPNHKNDFDQWVHGCWMYLPINMFINSDGSFKKYEDAIVIDYENKEKHPKKLKLKLGKSFNNLQNYYKEFFEKTACNIL